jgi:hypothetical protein
MFCRCGDDGIQLDSKEQLVRAQLVEGQRVKPSQIGCHGMAQIVKELPYTSYVDLWILPVDHAALFGVVKGFWHLVMNQVAA